MNKYSGIDLHSNNSLSEVIWSVWRSNRPSTGIGHARRKFYDLHEARPSALTTEALHRIGELYAIEAKIRGKPPHERHQARQAEAKPLIDDLERWLRVSVVSAPS